MRQLKVRASVWGSMLAMAGVLAANPADARTSRQGTPEQVVAAQIAEAALRAAPVWDGHNDTPEQLRDRRGNMIADFDFRDTTGTADPAKQRGAMQTDLTRLRKGRVGAQFWSVYVSALLPEPQAVQATLEQIDVLKRLVARYPQDLQLATSARDVEQAMKRGRIASLIGMEGGHAIGSSLGVLRQMRELGVRYMTLAHFKTTAWADSATDKPVHGGLSPFGREVVREMQRIGILVDLSHVSEETMQDALDVVRAPVIFSHSGARAVDAHPRNVPDAVLRRVAENGGIVMVDAYPSYVSEERRQWGAALEAEKARAGTLFPGDAEAAARSVEDWRKAHPEPRATIAQVADHIDHVRAVAGIDHIGIGGDYDGMPMGPEGMEDVSGYPALFTELARRGYSQRDLEKIASRNMLRVLLAADAYARAHAGDPPVETPVKNPA